MHLRCDTCINEAHTTRLHGQIKSCISEITSHPELHNKSLSSMNFNKFKMGTLIHLDHVAYKICGFEKK